MTADEAMRHARRLVDHYRAMQENFGDMPEEAKYCKHNADTLEALCDEVNRLRHDLLVAVGRP